MAHVNLACRRDDPLLCAHDWLLRRCRATDRGGKYAQKESKLDTNTVDRAKGAFAQR
jgi:hypothetical protein